ncbi:MAG TPA: hypothetical protein VH479_13960, partial [Acidimicrobiales bacterium]
MAGLRAVKGWSAAALVGGFLVVATPDVALAAVGGTVLVPIDGNFHFDGAAGFVNNVTVTKTGTTVTLDDVQTVAIAGGPCSYPNPADDTFVQCTVGANTPDVNIEPADMGDTVTVVGG